MDKNIDNPTGTSRAWTNWKPCWKRSSVSPMASWMMALAPSKRTYNPRRRRARWQPVTNRAVPSRRAKATEPEKVILAKSGQHTIPYEVLEQARNKPINCVSSWLSRSRPKTERE